MTSELFMLLRAQKIIELSHVYEEYMPTWPTHPKFFCCDAETFENGDGNYNNLLHIGDHCGTHVDSPSHFIPDGKTIEQVDVRILIGRGVRIDVSHFPRNTAVTVDMIKEWEREHVTIQTDDIVFFRTGYDWLWKNRADYKDVLSNWSGLSGEGADYLLNKGVHVIGSDAMSLDVWSDSSYPAHQRILGSDNLIMENLANLDLLPDYFTFIALPLKIKNGSASPVRAIALVSE